MLEKFGPGLIGTWSRPDQTLWPWSESEIFPKTPDYLVSGLGNLTWAKTVQTRSGLWTGTNYLITIFKVLNFTLII